MQVDISDVEVLLVEDSPSDVELTLRALRKHNFANKVHVVEDGAQALDFLFARGSYARANNESLKVVLLDLKLPKVDGIEVLREIRGAEQTRTLPVVVLTSSREERDVVEAYKLGVNSYVVKPIEFSSFVEAIAEIGLYWLVLNKPPR